MEEVPLLKALHTKYANQAVIVGISIDTELARTDRTIKEKGMVWPVLADGKGFDGPIPQAYRIQGTPDIFVLDRAGKILARPGSATQIDAILGDALAPRGLAVRGETLAAFDVRCIARLGATPEFHHGLPGDL